MKVPRDIRSIEELAAWVHGRDKVVETAWIKAGLRVQGTLKEGKKGKIFNLDSFILLSGSDSLRIQATKWLPFTTPIFDLWIMGDKYTLASHRTRTVDEGRTSQVQKDRPDLAMLPPDLGGKRLLYPHLDLAEGETYVLLPGKRRYAVWIYRRHEGRAVLARRIYFNRKTLLPQKIQVFQPDGGLLVQVAYSGYAYARVEDKQAGGEDGEAGSGERVPYPTRINISVKNNKVKLQFKVKDLWFNRDISRFFKVPPYPNYGHKKAKPAGKDARTNHDATDRTEPGAFPDPMNR